MKLTAIIIALIMSVHPTYSVYSATAVVSASDQTTLAVDMDGDIELYDTLDHIPLNSKVYVVMDDNGTEDRTDDIIVRVVTK